MAPQLVPPLSAFPPTWYKMAMHYSSRHVHFLIMYSYKENLKKHFQSKMSSATYRVKKILIYELHFKSKTLKL